MLLSCWSTYKNFYAHFIHELAVRDKSFLLLQYNDADELLIYDPQKDPEHLLGSALCLHVATVADSWSH